MYSTAREYRWVNGKLVVISEVKRDRDEIGGWYTEYSTFKNGAKQHSKRIYRKDER